MQKYTAIILTSKEIGEFDRLYFLYTLEQGLLKVAAKGVRRPAAKLAGHLEPATLSEVYVARSRGRGQITSAITLESFCHIKKNFGKLSEFLKISRFFLKNFSEGEKDKKIFSLLSDFLGFMNQGCSKIKSGGASQDLVLEAFWWKIFDALGNRPDVSRCVVCGEKLRANSKKSFGIEKGGVVCLICGSKNKDAIPISDNQIKLMRLFLSNSLGNIAKIKVSKEELKSLAILTKNFSEFHFE